MGNDPVNIRKAAPADLPDVYRLICELEDDLLHYETFSGIFLQNLERLDCCYRVATAGDKVIGFISLHIQQLLHHCGAVGEVQEFYIDQEYRGSGIAKKLMDEVKEYAKTREVKSLEVASNRKRSANVGIYESLGFNLTHHKFTI